MRARRGRRLTAARASRSRLRGHGTACRQALAGLVVATLLQGCATAVPVEDLPAPAAGGAAASASAASHPGSSAASQPGNSAASQPEAAAGSTPAAGKTAPVSPALAAARNPREHWSDLVKHGRLSLRQGNLAEAEDSFTRAYDLTRAYRHGDPRTTTSIDSLERLASAYLKQGDSKGFGRVMELLVFVSGETSEARTLKLAQLLQNFAATRTLEGRPDDAREALELSLAITTEQKGQEDAALVGVLTQLALAEIAVKDLDAAGKHVDRAMQIATAASGDQSIAYATTLLARSKLEHARGDDDAARKTLQTAVDIHVQQLGPDDAATAGVVRELALFDQETGHDAEAEKSFQRVIDIWDTRPDGAYQRAQSRNELAWFFVETGQPARAVAPARSALAMLEEQKRSGQPIAAVADTLATALRDQGKYDEAEALYQRALTEAAKAKDLPGWSAAPIADRYAVLLEDTGRKREAQALRSQYAAATEEPAPGASAADDTGP